MHLSPGITAGLLLAWLIPGLTTVEAGTGVESWRKRFGLATAAEDTLTGLGLDGYGNVVVSGHTRVGVSENARAIVTIKYGVNGAAVWTNHYQASDQTNLTATALNVGSRSGRSYVSGYSLGPSGRYAYLTLAYANDGTPLWTNWLNTAERADEFAMASAIDEERERVYVAGLSIEGYGMVAYANDGTAQWTNRISGSTSYHQPAVAVDDSSGHVYLAVASVGDNWDCLTVSYDTSGAIIWSNRFNRATGNSELPGALAVDSVRGNVYVLCLSGATIDGSSGFSLVAYSSAGAALWTQDYHDTTNPFRARALTVNPATGTLHVAGGIYGESRGFDFATVAYSAAGLPLWTNRCDDGLNQQSGAFSYEDMATAVDVDEAGHVYLTGLAYGSNAITHCTTLAYSNTGLPLWTNRYLNTASGTPVALAVDRLAGRVLIGAASADYVTLAYSISGAALWTNFFSGTRSVEDTARSMALDRARGRTYVTGVSRDHPYDDFDWITSAYSADGSLLWHHRFNGPASNDDSAQAMAVDEVSGRIYVAGSSTFSGNQTDFAVLVFSSNGALLRTNRYAGSGNGPDVAQSVSVNSSNGSYVVTGYAWRGATNYTDFAIVAYESTGRPLWTNYHDGGVYRDDHACAVLVDERSGNTHVTGYSQHSDGYNRDYVTITYSGAGLPLWTNRYHGPFFGDDTPHALAINRSNGQIYVAGHSRGNFVRPDMATIAYSSQGQPLWTNRYDGPPGSSDTAEAIAVDDNTGQVYVSGWSDNGTGLRFVMLLAYSAAGVPIWTNAFHVAPNSNDTAESVAIDERGNVYVAGYSVLNGDYDQFLLVYSSSGFPLYTNIYRGPLGSSDQPVTRSGVAVNPLGEAFVAGTSDGDLAIIKYVYPPEIYSQPQSQVALKGMSASFGVTVAGTFPLEFRWSREGTPLENGGPIAGASSTELRLYSVEPPASGDYSVLVSNSAGSTVSLPAHLTVLMEPPPPLAVRLLPTAGVQVSGSTPSGTRLSLELSTNLITWVPLVTLTNSGAFAWNDFSLTNSPQRFYRAQLLP